MPIILLDYLAEYVSSQSHYAPILDHELEQNESRRAVLQRERSTLVPSTANARSVGMGGHILHVLGVQTGNRQKTSHRMPQESRIEPNPYNISNIQAYVLRADFGDSRAFCKI